MYTIGSGQTKYLLSKNKESKTYKKFLSQFFGIEKVVYNAYASPIDAARIGQITEDRYYEQMDDGWFTQTKVVNKDMNVLIASLDVSKLVNGKVIDFEEVKSLFFIEFIELDEDTDIKVKFKNYYNQIQHQLLCSGLNEATLTFICVYDYNDEEAYKRVIEDKDIKKYKISRDEDVFNQIIENAKPFQLMKNYLEK
ncbi:hypothetical protein LJB88_03180 [Erysipelotrichaceae bacterium OttesenSCG-928-M19]|nr:hypothetical protein [Erysipelotrichaceae bacterium OttesenSCG-928-M19]